MNDKQTKKIKEILGDEFPCLVITQTDSEIKVVRTYPKNIVKLTAIQVALGEEIIATSKGIQWLRK